LLLGLALLALQAEGDLLGGLGLQGGQCKDQGPSFLWQCIVKALTWPWKMREHKILDGRMFTKGLGLDASTHLLVQNGLGLTTVPLLLPVISPLALLSETH
jgi:hypothetical protein